MFFLFILCFMIHETTLNFPVPTMRATKIEKQKRKLSSSDKTTLTKVKLALCGFGAHPGRAACKARA